MTDSNLSNRTISQSPRAFASLQYIHIATESSDQLGKVSISYSCDQLMTETHSYSYDQLVTRTLAYLLQWVSLKSEQ